MSLRRQPYDKVLALARRHSRTGDDAEDLAQAALLAALVTGRSELADDEVMGWLAGTVRNLGALQARGAARRRQREHEYARRVALGGAEPWALPNPTGLPPALARTARLLSAGPTRDELRWLLGISDAALRQRLTALRRVAQPAEPLLPPPVRSTAALRPHLLAAVKQLPTEHLCSHDPDGHSFFVRPSHPATARQRGGEPEAREPTC